MALLFSSWSAVIRYYVYWQLTFLTCGMGNRSTVKLPGSQRKLRFILVCMPEETNAINVTAWCNTRILLRLQLHRHWDALFFLAACMVHGSTHCSKSDLFTCHAANVPNQFKQSTMDRVSFQVRAAYVHCELPQFCIQQINLH